MHAGTQHLFFFFSYIQSRISAREWFRPQWVCFPTSVKVVKIILHRHTQRKFLEIILDFVKLTIDTKRHMWVYDFVKIRKSQPYVFSVPFSHPFMFRIPIVALTTGWSCPTNKTLKHYPPQEYNISLNVKIVQLGED